MHLEKDFETFEWGYDCSRNGTSDAASAESSDYWLRDEIVELAAFASIGIFRLDVFRALEDLSKLLLLLLEHALFGFPNSKGALWWKRRRHTAAMLQPQPCENGKVSRRNGRRRTACNSHEAEVGGREFLRAAEYLCMYIGKVKDIFGYDDYGDNVISIENNLTMRAT